MKYVTTMLLLFVCLTQFVFSANDVFLRTLKLGMRGNDVRALQKILNSDLATRIADSGDGSPGNETDYFGPATKRAVAKFQEKYREDILVPSGLMQGSGVFGERTRAKMNTLNSSAGVSQGITQQGTTTTSVFLQATTTASVNSGEIYIMSLSQYSGKPGTSVTMSGEGFTPSDNTIYFGSTHAIEKAYSVGGQAINFRIPDIPKGLYSLSIKNANGESDKEAFFVVTDGVTPEPKIENVALSTDNMITIKGSGFLKKGNVVRTSINIYREIDSSDGNTIIVPLKTMFGSTDSLPKATIFVERPKDLKQFSIPVWVYVVNNDGVSNSVNFTLGL